MTVSALPNGTFNNGEIVRWTCRSEFKGSDRAKRLAGKATLTSGLLLGIISSVEELETLPAGAKPRTTYRTIDRLKKRGVERGSARRSSLKGRERAIVSQTSVGTVSKATMWTFLRNGVDRI